MREVYEELLRLEAAGTPAALAVVTGAKGSTPQVLGAKLVVRADGVLVGTVGGGAFEKAVVDAALEVIREGVPRNVQFSLTGELGMCCGGTMQAFIEPVRARERLVIFGAGHVGRATAATARSVGFQVVVVDDRPDWSTADRFPGCELHLDEPEDFLDAFGPLRPADSILITTHDHARDRAIVDLVIAGPQRWTGMIGSRRKAAKTRDHLRLRGRSEEVVGRLVSPVGVAIDARSPEEIAVSIVAALIAVRHEGREKRPRPRVIEGQKAERTSA